MNADSSSGFSDYAQMGTCIADQSTPHTIWQQFVLCGAFIIDDKIFIEQPSMDTDSSFPKYHDLDSDMDNHDSSWR